MSALRNVMLLLALASLSCLARADGATGKLMANGKEVTPTYAKATEVDSTTEPGYLDIVVVLSDRPVPTAVMGSADAMEKMTRERGLAALRLVIDPDAKIKSAAPYHPAFTTFLGSAAFVRWEPSAYNEKQVAGRVHSGGERNEFGQRWKYDLSFSAAIILDPKAKTVPKQK